MLWWRNLTGLRVVAFSACFMAVGARVHEIAQHPVSETFIVLNLLIAVVYAFFGVVILLRGTE